VVAADDDKAHHRFDHKAQDKLVEPQTLDCPICYGNLVPQTSSASHQAFT